MDLIIGFIVKRLIKRAVRKLGEEQRERCEEEWLAHIRDTSDTVGKLIAAIDFLRAATSMSSGIAAERLISSRLIMLLPRVFDILLAVSLLFICAPLIVFIAIAIKAGDGGPILSKRSAKDWKGQTVSLFTFRTGFLDSSPGRTSVGWVLQTMGLHELPVLIDLLRGTITFREVREVLKPPRRSRLR
jgi:hypothetical protein